ncbi:hypothetical protein [Qipengyuania vesicularis]|uniref:hypothetical protein n=1 Tax=Qipengyuania vesicularis TaxID=2867232 RepID=UPI001C8806F2|nr:hypothetical protein [Qipengyuania vesicularis]MBX7528053.1 hypothetical protein [Qipengyuania vesicularis]
MTDGACTITIDANDDVSASPDPVTPDTSNNIVFTLQDNSGHGWVFDEDRPIIITNPTDFTITRTSGSELQVYDSEQDRGRIPEHKYQLRFTRAGQQNPMVWDPVIRDRVNG